MPRHPRRISLFFAFSREAVKLVRVPVLMEQRPKVRQSYRGGLQKAVEPERTEPI